MITGAHFGHNVNAELPEDVAASVGLAPGRRNMAWLVTQGIPANYIRAFAGTQVERYGTTEPLDGFFASDLPLADLLAWATRTNRGVHLPIPCRGLTDPAAFARRLAAVPGLDRVDTCTIGNEFWANNDTVGGPQTIADYAAAVNRILPHVAAVLPRAAMLVQAVPSWYPHGTNADLARLIAPGLWSRIAGIEDHWYPAREEYIGAAFRAPASFGPLTAPRVLIGEWNTQFNAPDLPQGVHHAMHLAMIFHALTGNPQVRWMAVWGSTGRTLRNRLATVTPEGLDLTPSGQTLAHMRHLEGWTPIPGKFFGANEEVTFARGDQRSTYLLHPGAITLDVTASVLVLRDDPATPRDESDPRWQYAAGVWAAGTSLIRAGQLANVRWTVTPPPPRQSWFERLLAMFGL